MKLIDRRKYFAICVSLTDGAHYISNMLYCDEAAAHKELGSSFVKLWYDGPSIVLPHATQEVKVGYCKKEPEETLSLQLEKSP